MFKMAYRCSKSYTYRFLSCKKQTKKPLKENDDDVGVAAAELFVQINKHLVLPGLNPGR